MAKPSPPRSHGIPDLYLTQRFARHASPLTTTIYTHPTDEELYEGIRGIRT